MPYTQQISRATPACVLFLLDHSQSMEEPLGGSGERKCDALAMALNAWLNNMIFQCSRSDGVRDYFEIAALSYGTDQQGTPIIRTAFQGELANCGETFLKIGSQIHQHPLRTVQKEEFYFDPETGQKVSQPIEVIEWIEPGLSGGTPMAAALYQACVMLDQWIETHRNCFPPIVIHITDGESTDADPVEYATAITQRETDDGNVLLFNCHLSAIAADKVMFHHSSELLPDDFAKSLFQMSSVLPDSFLQGAINEGFQLQAGARGFVFNADMVALIKFLNTGTLANTGTNIQLR